MLEFPTLASCGSMSSSCLPPLPQFQRQQLPQRILLRNIYLPSIRRRHRRIQSRVRIRQPLRSRIVQIRPRPRLQRLRHHPIARNRPLQIPRTGSSTHSTHAGGFSQRSRSSTSPRAARSSELPNRNGDKLPLCLPRRVCVLARMRKVAATDGWRFRCSDMSAPAGLPAGACSVNPDGRAAWTERYAPARLPARNSFRV